MNRLIIRYATVLQINRLRYNKKDAESANSVGGDLFGAGPPSALSTAMQETAVNPLQKSFGEEPMSPGRQTSI